MKRWLERRRAKRARDRAAGVRSWPRRLLGLPSPVPLTVEESIEQYNRKHPRNPLDLYQQAALISMGMTVEAFLRSPIGILPTGEMISMRLWQDAHPGRAGVLGDGPWLWLFMRSYFSKKKCPGGGTYPYGYGPEAEKYPGPSACEQRHDSAVIYIGDDPILLAEFGVMAEFPPPLPGGD